MSLSSVEIIGDTMKKRCIRKGSKGIEGTYANIEHHATGVMSIVKILESAVETYHEYIDEWIQGHNIHILKTVDGRKFAFRPYMCATSKSVNGVEVKLHLSRRQEIRIGLIQSIEEAYLFSTWISCMLDASQNIYGKKVDKE